MSAPSAPLNTQQKLPKVPRCAGPRHIKRRPEENDGELSALLPFRYDGSMLNWPVWECEMKEYFFKRSMGLSIFAADQLPMNHAGVVLIFLSCLEKSHPAWELMFSTFAGDGFEEDESFLACKSAMEMCDWMLEWVKDRCYFSDFSMDKLFFERLLLPVGTRTMEEYLWDMETARLITNCCQNSLGFMVSRSIGPRIRMVIGTILKKSPLKLSYDDYIETAPEAVRQLEYLGEWKTEKEWSDKDRELIEKRGGCINCGWANHKFVNCRNRVDYQPKVLSKRQRAILRSGRGLENLEE